MKTSESIHGRHCQSFKRVIMLKSFQLWPLCVLAPHSSQHLLYSASMAGLCLCLAVWQCISWRSAPLTPCMNALGSKSITGQSLLVTPASYQTLQQASLYEPFLQVLDSFGESQKPVNGRTNTDLMKLNSCCHIRLTICSTVCSASLMISMLPTMMIFIAPNGKYWKRLLREKKIWFGAISKNGIAAMVTRL